MNALKHCMPPTRFALRVLVVGVSLACAAVCAQSQVPRLPDGAGSVPGSTPGRPSLEPGPQSGAPPTGAPTAQDGLAPGETLVPVAPAAPVRRPPPASPNVAAGLPAGLGFDTPVGDADVERVVARRGPVRVLVQPGLERLVSFPGPVALHAPEGLDTLARIQIIDRTVYIKALMPFEALRLVAEDLGSGRQIPLDLVAQARPTSPVRDPLEIVVPGLGAGAAFVAPAPTPSAAAAEGAPDEGLDMVGLTRYAAQSLYAPRRLAPARPGVRSIPVRSTPIDGLYRGWRVRTTPIAAWRSGQLYVTAVRFDNDGREPHDLDLDDIRGRWLAATAQHRRLLPAQTEWNSTTVYLVCDRPFDACREQ